MYKRKRVDPRVIGSFVIGAILLGVGGLIFYGPGGLFSETKRYVLHFDSSVKGLTVGAPVRFRGVNIGQVKDISVRVSPTDFSFRIPVVIEIEPSRIGADGSKGGFVEALKSSVKGGDPIESLVKKGLRARLELDSLLTGRLFVNFDMRPDTPIVLSGQKSKYPELPTVPSSLGELAKTFEELPLRELAHKLISSADGFEKLINSPSLHNGLEKFDKTADQIGQLLQTVNAQLIPLAQSLQQLVSKADQLVTHFDTKIDPLTTDIHNAEKSFATAVQSFSAASEKTAQTMQQLKSLTSDDSRLQLQLSTTLQEVHKAARSVRYLTSELERDPQILLRGRANGGTP